MTSPSSESQTVVELGFELVSDSKAHVLIVSMRHAALHGRHTRKVWLPTMVLGIHENDATYTAEPQDEED